MLKSIANSKLFFVALGVTVALVGARISAAPSDQSDAAGRIADALEKLQRDGIDVKISPKWGSDEFKVKVVK